jgi:exodeoxyribonuclease V alpha subunit
METLEDLYKEIAVMNAEMEVLNATVQYQAAATLTLKRILLGKKIKESEKKLFDRFESERDEQYEQAAADTATVRAYLAKRAMVDPLGDEIEPLEEETAELPEDSTIVNYDIPEQEAESDQESETAEEIEAEIEAKELGKQESFALNITLNTNQLMAKELAFQGKSFCLTGAAGTGKTTAQRAVAESLLLDNKLTTCAFRTYDAEGARKYVSAPSIAFVAYTRRAASNLRKAVHKSPILAEKLEHNIMTIHALLEYEPETYQDYNEEGKLVDKFRFVPRRTAANPLTITHLVIEEASMLDAYTLWGQLYDALPEGVQIIFIGDINQLPPVFGPSILNYALVQLPVVELTEVYRNQGIVLENAHNILAGKTLIEDHNFVIVRGKSQVQVGQAKLATILGSLFNQWLDAKGSDGLPEYDPEDCIILSPWGKQELGTVNLNNWIAQHLGQRRHAIVHEVIAGFNKLYLAKGDKVMVNKMDGVITDIYRNPAYHGREPQIAGSDLTRFGVRVLGQSGQDSLDDIAPVDYSTFSLEALENEKGERKQQASHVVVVQLESGQTEELKGAGDFGEQTFSLGYALTVHKAQGSEWRKVFIVLHKDHAVSLYRELFYTAETRARTKVTIIAKDAVINKAIANQRIKGKTMQDKIDFFNAGVLNNNGREPVYATK